MSIEATVGPDAEVTEVLRRIREPVYLVVDPSSETVKVVAKDDYERTGAKCVGILPPLFPEWLGERSFLESHGVRFPFVVGEMANGIASVELVAAAARAGILAFFGSAGLSYQRVSEEIDRLNQRLEHSGCVWGVNLIHSPNEPALESRLVELYIAKGVRRVCASAFMQLTPSVVHFACSGLTADAAGSVRRRNYLFAKVSRPEVARHFMSPPPRKMLDELVAAGKLTEDEAAIAGRIPLATDITAEADSGGHTDNRPLTALFPTLVALREEIQAKYGYRQSIRLGAAGGLGTPTAVAAAFALGAAYVLTGSVNQAAVESGLSDKGRQMLADAGLADIGMAAAADMFEAGVKVQVLTRGTMFAARANKLYEFYRRYDSLDDLPPAARQELEQKIFRAPLEEIWVQTESFWRQREPAQVDRAKTDQKHRMALVLRWYLGKSSRWAIEGDGERKLDYQIWCGPAMGAFNQWVKGSFLEDPQQRSVVQITLNLLEGAAVATRAQQARSYGVEVPDSAFSFKPRKLR